MKGTLTVCTQKGEGTRDGDYIWQYTTIQSYIFTSCPSYVDIGRIKRTAPFEVPTYIVAECGRDHKPINIL